MTSSSLECADGGGGAASKKSAGGDAAFDEAAMDRGGVAALLSIPKGALSVDGFHRCLFAVSQSPSAMERLLAPGRDAATSAAARRCVDVALEALDGGHETARRHAALFLALSFPFPAVVDAFDAAGGLRPLLNLLRHAAQLSAAATAAAKQTACHACHALRQYARAHLHRRVSRFLEGNAPDPGYRAVDLGQAATDRNLRAASRDPRTLSKAAWRAESEWRSLVSRACFVPPYAIDHQLN